MMTRPPVPPLPPPCATCGTTRRRRFQTGTAAFPIWTCGTCQHRQSRRINTRERTGRGRRGY